MANAEGKWRLYAEERPTRAGVYEWRLPSVAVPGMVVTFAAHMRKRGAGYTEMLSPLFDYWDGYRVHVPDGTEWRECAPVDIKWHSIGNLAVEGLTFEPCIYCGKIPVLQGVQRSLYGGTIAGGDPHNLNSWWLSCCQWGNTPHLSDPREIERIRRTARNALVAERVAQVENQRDCYRSALDVMIAEKNEEVINTLNAKVRVRELKEALAEAVEAFGDHLPTDLYYVHALLADAPKAGDPEKS